MNPFYSFCRFGCLVILLCLNFQAQAQLLEVTPANTGLFTPETLISNIFLGDGVEVVSINYAGSNGAIGYFTGGTNAIGINRGIVMTTGIAKTGGGGFGADDVGGSQASVDNPSTAYDADLASLTTSGTNDAAVYTITFIPTSDTLRFSYCFGSEEYPEYACSPFNDVFGFFIQGPGFPTFTNIAIIPNTTLPVTINNLHPANPVFGCGPLNDIYYNSNNGSNMQPTYDGFTDVFTAQAVVVPCQQYTIKLAIADVSDNAFDSGVFLEAKSFGTGSINAEATTVSLDGTVTEGCAQGTISFQLPNPAVLKTPIDYNIWGTAVNGVDYETISDTLSFAPGQQNITIPIVGFEDNIPDPGEFLAIDIQVDPCNRDTLYIYFRENTLVAPNLIPDTSICIGQTIQLDGTAPVPLPDPPTFTNTQDFLIQPTNTAVTSPINVFGVQPVTLGPGSIRSVCLNATHTWVDDLDVYLFSPSGQFLELSTDNGANGDNYTNTCFTLDASTVISSPGPFAPAAAAPFTNNWQPEGPWNDLWDGTYPANGTWQLRLIDDANGFTGTLLDWTITFEPLYQINYQWFPIAGVACPTCPVTDVTPTQSGVYTIQATDTYGCVVQDSVVVNSIPNLLAPLVSCSGQTSTNITFNWTAVSGATGYEVNVNGTGWVPANGINQHDVSGLTANSVVTIEVRATGAQAGCNAEIGTTTCSNCLVPVVNAQVTSASCAGLSDGQATFVPDGLNPPYAFAVGSQANTTGVFSGLAPGNYVASITDNSGCEAQVPINIPEPSDIVLSTSITQPILCFGGVNGQLQAVASGGTGTLSYVWNDPTSQTTPDLQNLPTGQYTVTVSDLNGCTETATIDLPQPTELLANSSAQDVLCNGGTSGELTATATGGTMPYQFAWTGGLAGSNPTNIAQGMYTVTVTDGNGCTQTSTAVVAEPTLLTGSTAATDATCFGSATASATVSATGGTFPYTYLWNDPSAQTTATATGLTAQTFSVTVTDVNGCTLAATATPAQPTALTLNISPVNALCNGEASGNATAIPGGGISGYTYLWSDNQTTPTATGLLAGNFSLIVTDVNGCTISGNTTVGQPEALSLSTTVQNTACSGSADGGIDLTVVGGTLPYNYLWDNNATTQDLINVPSGAYFVLVSDANNCLAEKIDTINAAVEIMLSAVPQNATCFGLNNGSIVLSASGGTGTYTTTWTGPGNYTGSGISITGLLAGDYTATVTDGNGCSKTLTSTIDQPLTALDIVLPAVSDTVCFNVSNGTASVTASGGTSPYTYQWETTTISAPNISQLGAGFYGLTVTDNNGCSQTSTTQIFGLEQVIVQALAQDPSCFGGNDGSAAVTEVAYGNTPANLSDFTYLWNTVPSQTTSNAYNLQAGGNYAVTVTDATGCTGTTSVALGIPNALAATIISFEGPDCFGAFDGWAEVTATGGTAPYTYFWSPTAQTTARAENLGGNITYNVTVTDSRGCAISTNVVLPQPAKLEAQVQTQGVLCYGESTGSATALVSGGVLPYAYLWSNGLSNPELTQLATGPLSLVVTDANGCSVSVNSNIGQPAEPLAGTTSQIDAVCFGENNGRIQIDAQGGTPPYRYALDNRPSNGSPVQIGLQAGTYTPIITDGNGCTLVLNAVTVAQNPPVMVDLGPDISIELGQTTQLNAVVTGATGTLEYIWDPAGARWLSCLDCPDPNVDTLFYPQYFSVEVVDELGCSGEDQILVKVYKPRRIFVPTGFTPNGDFNNDLLLVHGQASAQVLDFRVYDRWGELVYQAGNFVVNDETVGWDGKFRDKDMDPAVFVWVLEVKYLDGETEVLKGETTLIR
ncbi:MAG: choice-of-anchor L domain-containing protein [Saprospiraceae bacterium]|nr:choice-of-anchor L domain-containing protein [Saprospiraceae bacterium]MCC6414258.1 choice-of-anchor L domain-containing protein [Saprospiraceae bacterium]